MQDTCLFGIKGALTDSVRYFATHLLVDYWAGRFEVGVLTLNRICCFQMQNLTGLFCWFRADFDNFRQYFWWRQGNFSELAT